MPTEGSFGITVVDQLLGGSLLRGKSYLLEADNGTQPHSLVFAFVNPALSQGELVVYASNEEPAEDVMTKLGDSGIDVAQAIKKEQLLFLDLWTEKEEPIPGVLRVGNPGDPHKVMFVYNQAYDFISKRKTRTPSRVIIESFSGT
ncbi:MAG: RAD55 family ATPase, partial [Promethearchaeota archaeon]